MKHPSHLAQVANFHEAFRVRIAPAPDLSDSAINQLRCSLLREELLETAEAIRENNRVEILDGLCDSQYVLCGAVLSWGYRSMWENVTHKIALRKIHDADAHLVKMLGLVNHLEIVAVGGMEWSVWGYLVELQETLTELVCSMGFSSVFGDAFAEVHRSNMSKKWNHGELPLVPDGSHGIEDSDGSFVCRNASGKIIKSPSYSPASLEQFA